MKRYIRTAKEDAPTMIEVFEDAVSALKDDFDFAINGVEKINADGNTEKAIELVRGLSEMINASIEEIAENIAQED